MKTPKELGLIADVAGGIQIDINAVKKTLPSGEQHEASLCDHNCTADVGGYDCPAAFSHNKGTKPHFAPPEKIIKWITLGRGGLRRARDVFLREKFNDYCEKMDIPDAVQDELMTALQGDRFEVNLFGGNPEMHPYVLSIITSLKQKGFKVNLTTTGRRFMKSTPFLDEFLIDPPHVLALSADDFEKGELPVLLKMEPEEMRTAWKNIPPTHGQKQKCLEALYTAKILGERTQLTILFNMVLHPGNAGDFHELFTLLTESFPNVLINPYPTQTRFFYEEGDANREYLEALERVVDFMIHETIMGNRHIVLRLHYWLAMKAVFGVLRGNGRAIADFVSGAIWRCYTRPGMMYLQIGQGPKNLPAAHRYAGGHLGCFWNNQTITQTKQIMSAQQTDGFIRGEALLLSKQTASPCGGCAFPRLMFDMITTERGLHKMITPAYIQLRKKYAGF